MVIFYSYKRLGSILFVTQRITSTIKKHMLRQLSNDSNHSGLAVISLALD